MWGWGKEGETTSVDGVTCILNMREICKCQFTFFLTISIVKDIKFEEKKKENYLRGREGVNSYFHLTLWLHCFCYLSILSTVQGTRSGDPPHLWSVPWPPAAVSQPRHWPLVNSAPHINRGATGQTQQSNWKNHVCKHLATSQTALRPQGQGHAPLWSLASDGWGEVSRASRGLDL